MYSRVPAGERAQLQGAALVEADHCSAFRRRGIEVEEAVFLTSKSGSGEAFQVLGCWKEMPSRRRSRRTHSPVMGGNRSWARPYALSLATDPSAQGRPKSSGRLRATLIKA